MACPPPILLQTIVKCDKCQRTSNVSSFCINCVGNLCDDCKQQHLAEGFTSKHRVLPRNHPLVIKARRRDRTPCSEHDGYEFVSYCQTCKCFCCLICMTRKHKEHDVDAIEDAGEKALQNITDFIENYDKNVVPVLAVSMQEKEKRTKDYDDMEENCKQALSKRMDTLREELRQMEIIQRNHIAEVFREQKTKLTELLDGVKHRQDTATDALSRCRHTRDHGTYKELIQFQYPETRVTIPPEFTLSTLEEYIFEDAKYSFPSTREVIGDIRKIQSRNRKQIDDVTTKMDSQEWKQDIKIGQVMNINTKEKDQTDTADASRTGFSEKEANKPFDTGRIDVNVEITFNIRTSPANLFVTENGNVWSSYKEYLKCYTANGQNIRVIRANLKISRFVITFTGQIIATDHVNKRLVRVHDEGKVETLRGTAPMEVKGICINNKYQLVVGHRVGIRKPPIKLVIYSNDASDIVKEIENDTDGKPLFENEINQVKQNGNGDYIALDGFVRVVCLSERAERRWEHKGDFMWDIVCDGYNNVIICEYTMSQINLLDKDGKFLRNLLTRYSGITSPCSLCIDSRGCLLIGQFEGKVSICRYLK